MPLHQLTETSPLDEVNRPCGGSHSRLRIPPAPYEVVGCSMVGRTNWPPSANTRRRRAITPPALVSLIGPRVSELCLLRMGDIRWELGRFGKILLRGKGSRGRGKKERLVPLITGTHDLLDW
jgi:hypothetical protein